MDGGIRTESKRAEKGTERRTQSGAETGERQTPKERQQRGRRDQKGDSG